jgi:hypothetical protein
VLCAAGRDPVSSQEESTGVCTACNQTWEAAQSVAVHVTSTPLLGTVKV